MSALIPVPLSHIGLIALGGGAGAVMRFLTGHWVNRAVAGNYLPWGTFAANIIGSFLIGVVIMLTIEHGSTSRTRLMIVTGFLGGFTTFSAFSFEVSEMLIDRKFGPAAIYGMSSLLLCVTATLIGAYGTAALLRGFGR